MAGDVVELYGKDSVAALAPGAAEIRAVGDAAVVAGPDRTRIGPIEQKAVLVGVLGAVACVVVHASR